MLWMGMPWRGLSVGEGMRAMMTTQMQPLTKGLEAAGSMLQLSLPWQLPLMGVDLSGLRQPATLPHEPAVCCAAPCAPHQHVIPGKAGKYRSPAHQVTCLEHALLSYRSAIAAAVERQDTITVLRMAEDCTLAEQQQLALPDLALPTALQVPPSQSPVYDSLLQMISDHVFA